MHRDLILVEAALKRALQLHKDVDNVGEDNLANHYAKVWANAQWAFDLMLRFELLLKFDGGPSAKAPYKQARRATGLVASMLKRHALHLQLGEACDYGPQRGITHLLERAIDEINACES